MNEALLIADRTVAMRRGCVGGASVVDVERSRQEIGPVGRREFRDMLMELRTRLGAH